MNKLNFPTHFQDNLHSFIESLQKEDENFFINDNQINLANPKIETLINNLNYFRAEVYYFLSVMFLRIFLHSIKL